MLLATVPATPVWSPTIALVMILCNVFAVILWKSSVSLINNWLAGTGFEARAGSVIPEEAKIFVFNFPGVSLSLPELLAAASFGHLIGAGVILGLSNLGGL
jgi:photosystem I subunit 10